MWAFVNFFEPSTFRDGSLRHPDHPAEVSNLVFQLLSPEFGGFGYRSGQYLKNYWLPLSDGSLRLIRIIRLIVRMELFSTVRASYEGLCAAKVSNHLFHLLDLYWLSSEFGGVWYRSRGLLRGPVRR